MEREKVRRGDVGVASVQGLQGGARSLGRRSHRLNQLRDWEQMGSDGAHTLLD